MDNVVGPTDTVVVIPTVHLNYIFSITDMLMNEDEVSQLIILDNGHKGPDARKLYNLPVKYPKVFIYPAQNENIYHMWNMGWDMAQRIYGHNGKPFNIAFFNDDVAFGPNTMKILAWYLRAEGVGITYPDYNLKVGQQADYFAQQGTSTYGRGGVSGFAFMTRGELPLRFDEEYVWWYGDDQFVMDVENLGFICMKVVGLPLEHAGSMSAKRNPYIEQVIQKDITHFNKKNNEQRTRW